MIIVGWCLIFVLSIEQKRALNNWGYANYIYLVFALFPLVFLSNKKFIKYSLIVLLVIATLVSKKRTAVLLLVAYSIIFVFSAFRKKRIKKIQLVVFLVASLAVVVLCYSTNLIDNISSTYLYRFDTTNDDTLNGRLYIWTYGLSRWWSGSIFDILFGSNITYASSDTNVGLTMHNDYIEMLTNYGVVGLIITVVFIVWLINKTISIKGIITKHYLMLDCLYVQIFWC